MKTTINLLIMIMLCACQQSEKSPVVNSTPAYESQVFNQESQQKIHKVAAFVEPTDHANLSFQVSGIIEQQMIKIGEEVSKDQVLFTVTNPSLGPQIEQFNSEIEAINATLEQNKAEVNRVQNLKKTNAISQNELDRLLNQQDNLKATRKSLEAQLDQAQSLFDETQLVAPFDGHVADLLKEPGEVVAAGEPVLRLSGVSAMEAPIHLPSHLQRSLNLSDTLNIQYKQHDMQATIKEISRSANPQSQLFKITLSVPTSHGIQSGEKIDVTIPEKLGEHHRIPLSAVIDDGINQPFIYLIVDSLITTTPVKLLEIDGDEVVIELPQQGSVEVVVSGQVNLLPGQKVNPS